MTRALPSAREAASRQAPHRAGREPRAKLPEARHSREEREAVEPRKSSAPRRSVAKVVIDKEELARKAKVSMKHHCVLFLTVSHLIKSWRQDDYVAGRHHALERPNPLVLSLRC